MVDDKRKKRIDEQIKRELGNVLLRNPKYPIFKQITITSVDVSVDLSVAKVLFSVFDEAKVTDAGKILKDESGFLRKMLARNLNLRLTPRLYFVYDDSIKKSQQLSALIDEAILKDEKKN